MIFSFSFSENSRLTKACTSQDEWTERDVSVAEDEWTTSQEEKSLFFKKATAEYVHFSFYEPGVFAKNVQLHTLKYLSSCSSSVFEVQPKLVPNINCAKSGGGKGYFSCIFQIFLNPFFFYPFTLPSTWAYTWSALFRSDC